MLLTLVMEFFLRLPVSESEDGVSEPLLSFEASVFDMSSSSSEARTSLFSSGGVFLVSSLTVLELRLSDTEFFPEEAFSVSEIYLGSSEFFFSLFKSGITMPASIITIHDTIAMYFLVCHESLL